MTWWYVFVANCARVVFFSGSMKANGVILEEVVQRLDTTHAVVGWAFALQPALAYLCAPCTKMLLDSLGCRPVASFGGFLVGAGYIYFGLQMSSVYQLFIGFVTSGIGFGLATLPSYFALEQHFPGKFSFLLTIVSAFNFVGISLLPLLLLYLNRSFGISQGLVLFGAITLNLVPCGVALRPPTRRVTSQLDHQPIGGNDAEDGDEASEENEGSWIQFIERYTFCVSSLFHHPNFTIAIIVQSVALYLYTSWALFLVSLGTMAGLSEREAVSLTAAGGIGGLCGCIFATAVFCVGSISIVGCCFVPLLLNAVAFFLYSLLVNYYALLFVSISSGIIQGFMTTCLFALVPTLICRRHFREAVVLNFISDGLATQFGGFISGLIRDVFGCTRAVYLANALLSGAVLPLILIWACNDKPVRQCPGPSVGGSEKQSR